MLLGTPRHGSRPHPHPVQSGLSYKSGRCCLAVTGLGLAWTEYKVTICLKSCLAVALPCGLNYPFGEVLLKYERSESSCGGSSGSTSGPPRVTRMERSPANREARHRPHGGTWKAVVGILVCTTNSKRWLCLLLKKAEAGLAPREHVKMVLFLSLGSFHFGEEDCTGLGCEDHLWHSNSLQK